jgi:hypothetical protein
MYSRGRKLLYYKSACVLEVCMKTAVNYFVYSIKLSQRYRSLSSLQEVCGPHRLPVFYSQPLSLFICWQMLGVPPERDDFRGVYRASNENKSLWADHMQVFSVHCVYRTE